MEFGLIWILLDLDSIGLDRILLKSTTVVVRDYVTEVRRKLRELLQRDAKSPSLAQDFISGLLGGHSKICEAARILAPVS